MKLGFFLASLLLAAPCLPAQDNVARANALADRQMLEENTKRLEAMARDIVDLQMVNQQLQRKNEELRRELDTLRDDHKTSTARTDRYVTKEELRLLVEKMQEIEKNRTADKELIVQEFAELKKLMTKSVKAAAAPPPVAPKPPPVEESQGEQKGYSYEVQKGDTLLAIIEAYNSKLKERGVKGRITLPAVLKANPTLKPEAMPVGTKVFLPHPGE
ncbi:MAG: hypothetical protein AB1705_18415 [Verrucomicrobiota bacterium]